MFHGTFCVCHFATEYHSSYICGVNIFWFKNGQYSDKFVIIVYTLIIIISYFINAVHLHGEKQQK